MTRDEIHVNLHGAMGELAGVLWFIGWLFTLAYAQLAWWQALLGVIIWPYYLGVAAR
jgi:hypothetical protein